MKTTIYPLCLKILFVGLFCLLNLLSIAQYSTNNWEAGINLVPLTDKEAVYSLIFKRHLSKKNAIRFGVGGRYHTSKDEDYRLLSDQVSSFGSFKISYEYELERKNYQVNSFLGLQYAKGTKKLSLYGATDLVFNYEFEEIDAPKGVKYFTIDIPTSSYYVTLQLYKKKRIKYNLRQLLGIQYYVNNQFSISLEGGLTYSFNQSLFKQEYHFVNSFNLIPPNNSIGSSIAPWKKDWNTSLNVNLISLIIINYHF